MKEHVSTLNVKAKSRQGRRCGLTIIVDGDAQGRLRLEMDRHGMRNGHRESPCRRRAYGNRAIFMPRSTVSEATMSEETASKPTMDKVAASQANAMWHVALFEATASCMVHQDTSVTKSPLHQVTDSHPC
jgi:hypothetical protein